MIPEQEAFILLQSADVEVRFLALGMDYRKVVALALVDGEFFTELFRLYLAVMVCLDAIGDCPGGFRSFDPLEDAKTRLFNYVGGRLPELWEVVS